MKVVYTSLEAAKRDFPDAYVATRQMGQCRVCKREEDLRCGACFDCCDKVSGEPIAGGHRLWETAKPSNTWFVGTR